MVINSGSGTGTPKKKKPEEAGQTAAGSAYKPVDSSGNDYAGLAGMSDLHKAALDAATKSWHEADSRGDQAGRDAAHQKAESIRALYNYSGGGDGSEYIPTGQRQQPAAEKFSYESAPAYVNKYQDQIDSLTKQILGREAFSYDPETDPAYQQYRESYTRGGQRAMQDTLGQVSARTGGLASSYAGSAAQQTYDGYMSALADKIPELRQLAYQMYLDEGNTQRANLSMLQGLEQGDYGKYQDLLGQYNTDRSFAYGQHRDSIGDSRYSDETAYNRGIYADETAYNRGLARAKQLAEIGDFSGYKALGYSDEETERLQAAFLLQHPELASLYQTPQTGVGLSGLGAYGGGYSGGGGYLDVGSYGGGGSTKSGPTKSGSTTSKTTGGTKNSGTGSEGKITSFRQLGNAAKATLNHVDPNPNTVHSELGRGIENKTITKAEADYVMRTLGYDGYEP